MTDAEDTIQLSAKILSESLARKLNNTPMCDVDTCTPSETASQEPIPLLGATAFFALGLDGARRYMQSVEQRVKEYQRLLARLEKIEALRIKREQLALELLQADEEIEKLSLP